MNKNPVFVIIAGLSVIGIVIAVGILTKLRMSQEAAINGSAPVSAPVVAAPATTESQAELQAQAAAGSDAQTASEAAAAAAASRAAKLSVMEAADEQHHGEAPSTQ